MADAATQKPARPRRRLWRRIFVVLVLLVVAARIGGQMYLPTLAAEQAAKLGLEVKWERLKLSLLGGSFELAQVEVRRAGAPTAAPLLHLEALQFDLDVIALLGRRLRIHRVAIDGLDASVMRRADGTITLDGWSWPTAPAAPPSSAPAALPVAAATTAGPATTPPSPFDFTSPLAVDLLRIQNVRLHLQDDAVKPPLASDVVFNLSLSDLGSQVRRPRLDISLLAPGIVDTIELAADGTAHAATIDAKLKLTVHGLSAGLLHQYAPDAPVAPNAATFDLELAAGGALAPTDASALALAGNVAVERLAWRADGHDEVTAATHVEITSLSAHAADLALAAVDLRGRATRLASGALRIGGIDLVPAPPAADDAAAPTDPKPSADPADPADPAAPFTLRIGELRPTVAFHFRNEARTPAREVDLALHDSWVKNLALDPAHAETPIDVDVRADAAGATLAFTGTVLPFAATRRAELALKVGGLAGIAKELGLDTDWSDAALALRVTAQVEDAADRLVASVAVGEVRLVDGERELLLLDALRVPTFTHTASGISIDRIEVEKPDVAIARAADGTVRIAGVNFGAPPPDAAPAAPSATSPVAAPARTAPAPAPTAAANDAPAAARPAFAVGGVTIVGANVRWSDERVAPPIARAVGIDVKVGAVDLAAATPIPFELVAKAEAALGEFKLTGSATPDPDRLSVELDVGATGIHPDAVASYFPTKLLTKMKDGRVAFHAAASLERDADGRRAARASLTGFEVRDGSEGPPLIALAKFAAAVPEIAPASKPVVVSDLVVDGLKVAMPRGLVEADAAADAAPMQAALDFRQKGTWTVWSSDPESLPPLAFEIDISVPGFARDVRLGVTTSPFAARPSVELDFAATGLTGGGLAIVRPALAERVDASALADGKLTAKLRVELDFKRRRPGDFDLRDGFGGTVRLSDFFLYATSDGEPVVGVASIEAEITSLRPRSGDVYLRSLEIRNPVARIHRTAAGLSIGGVLLKNAPPGAEAPVAATPPAASGAAVPEVAPAAPAAPSARASEFRVDAFALSGLECEFVDDTATPPFIVPVKDLELEVRRFTTRAFTEPRPIQFRASVTGGAVDFVKRDSRSLIGGALSSAANVVVRKDKTPELEKRPAWESIDVNGQTTFVMPLTGWARLDVRSLELQALRGIAASGVQIHDGVVDSSVDARMRGTDGITVDSKTTFSYLSLQEPPNGPISSFLKLPAPLDTVLFLLRDRDGQQQVPLRFTVDDAGLSRAEVTRVATEALLRLIRDAITSAPMRVVSGALDAVQLSQVPGLKEIPGLGRLFGGKAEPKPEAPPLVFELSPGTTRLPEDVRRKLEPLFAALRSDPKLAVTVEHQLGSADRERFEKMARPRQQDLAALGARLRRKRDGLAARHEALAAEARGALAMGRAAAAVSASQDLRAADRELAVTEQAIDQVFAMHGEITPRDDDRLVRRACVMFAELRLADLRDLFGAAGIEDLATRLDIRPVRATPTPELVNSRIVIRTRTQL